MRYGFVTSGWAQHHHERWYNDVMSGKEHVKVVSPSEVDPRALPPETGTPERTGGGKLAAP